MTTDVLPASGTQFGDRVRRSLTDARVVWFTTVGVDGTPQPNPVWFFWDDGDVVTYNRPDAHRLAHIRSRPRVSLHFDGDHRGSNVTVLAGTAEIVPDTPTPDRVPAYVAKYGDDMIRVAGSMEGFGANYPVEVRVHITRVRGF